MEIISLFDGVSCGMLAAIKAGHKVTKYTAYEIDADATTVSSWHFPHIIRRGSVIGARFPSSCDLLIGGSPCQDLSSAGGGAGLDGSKSSLFWEYVRAWHTIKFKHFLFENVASMKKRDRDIISEVFGCEPIAIDSALVSAQKRRRLYWTNIPGVKQPEDRLIMLSEILETSNVLDAQGAALRTWPRYPTGEPRTKKLEVHIDNKSNALLAGVRTDCMVKYKVPRTPSRELMWYGGKCKDITDEDKSLALTTNQDRWCNSGLIEYEDFCRYLTPVECERLQGMPDGFTEMVSDRARYRVTGLGWQIDTIEHILSYI